ncbi:MAG TPA: prepilin peptidase [Rhodopila sp.]|nr:prepilin peptidase [Rhodopila sp.]
MLHNCILLLTPALKIAIASLLILAAARDIMTRIIPNWLPLALVVLCAALAAVNFRLLWGLGYGLAIFLLCIVLWKRGWMGGADVKLLGATAIVVAPSDAETFLLAVTLFGGLLALAYLLGRFVVPRPPAQRPLRLLPRVLRVEAWRIRHRGPLPYACAIAAGTLFVLSK